MQCATTADQTFANHLLQLEEMNYLFTNAPLFVPSMNMKEFETHDLENRVADVERKQSVSSHVE